MTQSLTEVATAARSRARPLSPDERRGAILDAVLPLVREHGRDISTRQIADAAGIAEGTIFRAFGDKETLIDAAVDRLFDPRPLLDALHAIPWDLALEEKVEAVIIALRDRFVEIRSVMASLGLRGRPPVTDSAREEWLQAIRDVLAADTHRLAISVDSLAHYIRLVAFSSAIEPINAAHPFAASELAGFVVFGVTRAGEPSISSISRHLQEGE